VVDDLVDFGGMIAGGTGSLCGSLTYILILSRF
jgi:hypothetical protein